MGTKIPSFSTRGGLWDEGESDFSVAPFSAQGMPFHRNPLDWHLLLSLGEQKKEDKGIKTKEMNNQGSLLENKAVSGIAPNISDTSKKNLNVPKGMPFHRNPSDWHLFTFFIKEEIEDS